MPPTRKILLLAALLIPVAFLVWWWGADPAHPVGDVQPRPTLPSVANERSAAKRPVSVEDQAVERHEVQRVADESNPAELAAPSLRFEWADDPGGLIVDRPAIEGEVMLVLFVGGEMIPAKFPIKAGRALLDVTATDPEAVALAERAEWLDGSSRLQLVDLVVALNGRSQSRAFDFTPTELIPGKDPLVIRLTAYAASASVLVDVKDERSGARIEEARFALREAFGAPSKVALVPNWTFDDALQSVPFEVTPEVRGSDVWVGAPGYAWGRVRIQSKQHTVEVRLAPESGLRILNEGAVAVRITVVPHDEAGDLPSVRSDATLAAGETLELGGLPAGDYWIFSNSQRAAPNAMERASLTSGEWLDFPINTDPLVEWVAIDGANAEVLVGRQVTTMNQTTATVARKGGAVGFHVERMADSVGEPFHFAVEDVPVILYAEAESKGLVCHTGELVEVQLTNQDELAGFKVITAVVTSGAEVDPGRLVACMNLASQRLNPSRGQTTVQALLGARILLLGSWEQDLAGERAHALITQAVPVVVADRVVVFPEQPLTLIEFVDTPPALLKDMDAWLAGVRFEVNGKWVEPRSVQRPQPSAEGQHARADVDGRPTAVLLPALPGEQNSRELALIATTKAITYQRLSLAELAIR